MTASLAPRASDLAAFIVRPCEPTDDDVSASIYLWLETYRRGWFGKAQCPTRSNQERAGFFARERSRVLWHIARDEVTLAADAEDPSIIHGLACMTGDTVHYAMVKRELAHAGMGAHVLRLLLGDRLTRSCAYTSEQNDLVSARLMPKYWYLDGGWYFREMERGG